jgi:pyruvate/2-oxoglutarate/acetoin dehydrogenase E1 component
MQTPRKLVCTQVLKWYIHAVAKRIVESPIRDNDPVIFMESEQMYGDKGEI